jgi:hypothetical protein
VLEIWARQQSGALASSRHPISKGKNVELRTKAEDNRKVGEREKVSNCLTVAKMVAQAQSRSALHARATVIVCSYWLVKREVVGYL